MKKQSSAQKVLINNLKKQLSNRKNKLEQFNILLYKNAIKQTINEKFRLDCDDQFKL